MSHTDHRGGGSPRPQRRARPPTAPAGSAPASTSTSTPGRGPGPAANATTSDDLLRGALDTVRAHGMAGATSRRITAAAGTNLAAITYWFGSKDELVAEAIFGDLERRLGPVLAGLESDDPPATRLLAAVRQLTTELERSADDVPLYLDALVLGTAAGPLADRGRQAMAGLRARLAAVIGDLVSAGAVASWIEPGAMAALLIASANGMALQSRLEPGGPAVTSMAAQMANLLLAAASGAAPPADGRSGAEAVPPGDGEPTPPTPQHHRDEC